MKTIAIVLASFCLTTVAMADLLQGSGGSEEARRRRNEPAS